MQLHDLKPDRKMRRGQRIGRGGKRGTTAGRGTKGQKARAGHKIRPQIRDIMKRIPKLRGHKFRSFQVKPFVISLAVIEKHFSKGEIVSLDSLRKKGILHTLHGELPKVKILGNTGISKNISVVGIRASKGARSAIQRAGGTVK